MLHRQRIGLYSQLRLAVADESTDKQRRRVRTWTSDVGTPDFKPRSTREAILRGISTEPERTSPETNPAKSESETASPNDS